MCAGRRGFVHCRPSNGRRGRNSAGSIRSLNDVVMKNRDILIVGLAGALSALCATGLRAGTINANPSNYKAAVSALNPGDTLNLAAGTYPRLNVRGVNGTSAAWITIQGPATGSPAVITVETGNEGCCNLVQLGSTSYLALKNLTVDSANTFAIDGVNSDDTTHDILVENCNFIGQGN